jgi:hypothetical protein
MRSVRASVRVQRHLLVSPLPVKIAHRTLSIGVEAWAADSEASAVQQDCDAAGARDGNVGLGIAVEVRNDESGSDAVHVGMDRASKRAATFVEE